MSQRVKLKIYLSLETYSKLVEYIARTKGKVFGEISSTIEEAVKEYLEKHAIQ